jgi:hypothetical protein
VLEREAEGGVVGAEDPGLGGGRERGKGWLAHREMIAGFL